MKPANPRLPSPEDASRRLIEGHGAVIRHIANAYKGVCSWFVHGLGSASALRPLSMAVSL
jgi:hypothetical protein